MRKTKADSFYSDVQKLIFRYSLLPVALALAVGIMLLMYLYHWSVLHKANQSADLVTARLESSVLAYVNEAAALKNGDLLLSALEDGVQKPTTAERLYGFVNKQSIRGDFYVFDAVGNCLISSRNTRPAYLSGSLTMGWGIFKRMNTFPEQTILMLNDVGSEGRSAVVLTLGQALMSGDGIGGYIVFELDRHEVFEYVNTQVWNDIVVTDVYDKALLTSKNAYVDEYSKLLPIFRAAHGVLHAERQSYYVSTRHLDSIGLRIYALTELSSLYSSLLWSFIVFLLTFCVMAVVMLLTTRKMVTSQTQSVDELMFALRKMQNEGIYTAIERRTTGHFPSLEASYFSLLAQIRELVEVNKQETARSAQAEIRQLEAQFNPHFLFNTLELIRCLIKLDAAAANQMILDFSALLRYSIAGETQYVPLKEDLAQTDRYVSILRRKHAFKLEYTVSIGPGTEELLVPKLILQPLVENAAKHGAFKRRQLNISVSSSIENGMLRLCVRDDGIGISAEKQKQLLSIIHAPDVPPEHMGLYNVHRRVRLMYGEKTGLMLRSARGGGTTVELCIPLSAKGGML